ncbi:molybdate ABC transporter substrate-binding protein [Marinomonas sp. RSW2]|uniref:Molybdate ABC transporter substrate-binding protein n=1 Tax=Marinomonas maritima TaxID=2940935 RepID=A0ABT5WB15_9GAMM|nr:molybdate ABC transporter substrate-binding protein [Marinomonas maritima]MDE8602016.1 molybdate ABC transporter substrate-binding protein [Marinomonas maritima]
MTDKTLLVAQHIQIYAKKIVLSVLFFCILFSPSPSLADTLRLAVASNFISPIKQLAAKFEQETGHSLQLSFGSSGKFFAQIKNNAPYDIFLSADLTKPQTLIKEQLALPDSLIIYARGKLALWSINPIPEIVLKDAILRAKRIAIANPKLAPYGKAAEESLRNLPIWDDVKNKIVQGENIGQTYQFVYSQNAEIGFVALSQVLTGQKKGHFISVPNKLHGKINQAAVILTRTHNIELANIFMAFIMRVDVQEEILQFGYSTE